MQQAEKIWFIQVDGREEGPYSLTDLVSDQRLTPDTLVWREGFDEWKAAKEIPELQFLFEEESAPVDEEQEPGGTEEELVLELQGGPQFPPILIFFLLLIGIILIIRFLWTP